MGGRVPCVPGQDLQGCIRTNLQAKSFHHRMSWVWWAFWLSLAQEGKDGGILWCTLLCMEFYWDPPFGKKTKHTDIGEWQKSHAFQVKISTPPVQAVFAIQSLHDLVPAFLLVLWVAGQAVHGVHEGSCCGVVACKHERLHFWPYVIVRQARLTVILQRGQKESRVEYIGPKKFFF